MKPQKDEQGRQTPEKKPPAAPPPDTSSDRDEWMEKQVGRPKPRPDIADAEGKFRS